MNLAILCALVTGTLLLCVAGWRMGERLTPAERAVSTLVAGMFGVAMIVLKILLHCPSSSWDDARRPSRRKHRREGGAVMFGSRRVARRTGRRTARRVSRRR
jgi:hypothetical protein